jgi:hypothetical protein
LSYGGSPGTRDQRYCLDGKRLAITVGVWEIVAVF